MPSFVEFCGIRRVFGSTQPIVLNNLDQTVRFDLVGPAPVEPVVVVVAKLGLNFQDQLD